MMPPGPGLKDDKIEWAWIGFFRPRLCEILREGGFEAESTIRSWKDEGWLATDSSHDGQSRCTKKARVGKDKSSAHLIAISQAAYKTVDMET